MYNIEEIKTILDNFVETYKNIQQHLPFDINTFNDLEDIIFCPDGVHIVNMLGSTNMFEDDQSFRDYISNLDPAEQGRFEYNLRSDRYSKMYMSFVYNGNHGTETAEPFKSYNEYKNFCNNLSDVYTFIDFLSQNGLESELDEDIFLFTLGINDLVEYFIDKNRIILDKSLKNKEKTTKNKVNKV